MLRRLAAIALIAVACPVVAFGALALIVVMALRIMVAIALEHPRQPSSEAADDDRSG